MEAKASSSSCSSLKVSLWFYVLVFTLIATSSAVESEPKEFMLTLDYTNFTDTISKHDFIIVEFYAPWCGHCKNLAPEYEKAASVLSNHDPSIVLAKVDANKEFENFIALANKLRSDYEFGHTLDAKHLPRGESSVSGPLVRLFKPFDELFLDTKDFDVDALEKFVEESSVPVVTIFDNDPSNHPFVIKYFNSPDAKAMLFTNFSSEVSESIKAKYHEVAGQYKGDGLIFLLGDIEASQGAFQYFGLKVEQAPLIIIQTSDGKKYLKSNLEAEQIASWVKDYKDGKVPAYKKSEPIPEVNNEPVKVVVADSLDSIVLNSGKNVLLEFYAPWCGHCKKLAPILDEIAVSYEKDADVVIAKIDATANDYPTDVFEVKGYPTMFFRSASGNLVQYEGDRTKEDIIDFIEKNRDKASQSQQVPAEDKVAQHEPTQEKQEKSVKDEL